MKWKIVLASLLICALAALVLLQWRIMEDRKAAISTLTSEVHQKGDRVDELEVSRERLIAQKRELLDQNSTLATQVTAANPIPGTVGPALVPPPEMPSDPADKGSMGNLLAKMMADPETKQMIREQQRMMMDQLYAPLIKQLGLSTDEAETFKKLLLDRTMKASERAPALFGGGSLTNRTELAGQLASEHKAFEAQMEELLGRDRFAQYKGYEETSGERMQLNMFRHQIGSGPNALTDDQLEQLLNVIKEEKRTLSAAGLSVPTVNTGENPFLAGFSEEQTEQVLQAQASMQDRVVERAKSILGPEQLSGFASYQTNQLQMMRMGMSMARKFFGPSQPSGSP